MNTQKKTPIWVEAFMEWADHQTRKWVRLSHGSFPDEIGLGINNGAKKEFASDMDWDLCKYCSGDKQRYLNYPVEQHRLKGLTKCSDCPIMILDEVHQMLFKEID